MKIEKIEIKTYKEKYVANDGTAFNDRDECLKYENSARTVAKIRLKEMAISEGSEYSILDAGSEDTEIYVIVPKSKEDIDMIRSFFKLSGQNDKYIASFTDDKIGQVILLATNAYDDCAWYTNLNDIVERATDGKFGVYDKEVLKKLVKQSITN